MIWPAELGEIECGKQWDIKFVPVKNCDSETLPLTFVIVISVLPCSGGVFAEEPESYDVVDGKEKKIPFDTWKEKIKTPNSGLKQKDEGRMEIERWSLDSENTYMQVTGELVRRGHNREWQAIREICKTLCKQENQHVNTKRVARFHLIAVECLLGVHADMLKNLIMCDKDGMLKIYAPKTPNQDTWKRIEEVLQDGVPYAASSLIPAAFYVNAASVLNELIDNESFIGVSRKDECFKYKVQRNVETVLRFCIQASVYLEHVKDDLEVECRLKQDILNIMTSLLFPRINDSQVMIMLPQFNCFRTIVKCDSMAKFMFHSLLTIVTLNNSKVHMPFRDNFGQEFTLSFFKELEKARIRAEHNATTVSNK